MRPYQEEYLANIREIAALTAWQKPDGLAFEEYEARQRQREALAAERVRRNLELLRENLFPLLDMLFEAGREDLDALEDFASRLWEDVETRDAGLFRLIQWALLSLARQREDRGAMIRRLYWLGMGYYGLCSKLVGMDSEAVEEYANRMRLCFTEAAAYLKYFDEIGDAEVRGYIIRSRANMSLGAFKNPGEKIRLVRETLCILRDEGYREKAPQLPWDQYLLMSHQQMAASISHSRDRVMSPEDAACIMESAYIVYQQRIQEMKEQHQRAPSRWAFSFYAIEYYCGIFDLEHLLARLEELLNMADPADRTPEGMYGILSLPAFYCQYLLQYPEYIPERAAYVDMIFRRALDYVDGFSLSENEQLSLYLRQLSYMYLETGSGIPFGVFLQKMMLRFMPEVYLHSCMVGTAARALCALILEEEPGFFDDMPEIRQLADPEEKRRQVLSDAMEGGLLHDVGKISVLELYSRTTRQWTEEEYEVTRLHTTAGRILLGARASTSRFAPVALGHHAWYDGSGHGYPAEYKRLECPCRQLVDVVGLVDWMENSIHSACSYTGIELSFDEAVEEAISLEGRRFSPMLTARLRDRQVTERLRQAFEDGRREAYRQMYEQNENPAKPEC